MTISHHRKHRLKILIQLIPLLAILGVVFIGVLQMKQVRQFFSRASGENADIVVDARADLGTLPRPWRNLAQGGEESNWRMNTYTNTVKALNPEYIRIDHIYSFYDIAKKDGGTLTFDFSKLDPLLDDIRATGATPFIALSYMPSPLSQSDIVGLPKDWNEYQLLIQKTIEHISGTKGFTNVYYEVWNEPDLFGGWKTYGDKNYLTLYTYAAKGAANTKNVKPFKFGGPGITALYENWFVRLTDHAQKNNLRYDFFSWHRYNTKLTQFTDDYAKANAWKLTHSQNPNLELLITEWGHDPKNHPGYDGNFSAAHTVAGSIEMVGQADRGFIFEIEDGKDPAGQARWGRWGMLTNEEFGAQPKPRYQALKLLDQIGTQQLSVQGNGSWVKGLAAKNTAQAIQLVLANYDDQAKHAETVPVTFTNIIPGEYTFKQTFLGGRQNTTTIATDAAIIKSSVVMPVNSVAFVELIPNFEIDQASPTALPLIQVTPNPEPASGFGRILQTVGE